jgi:hypothetical protein
VGALERAHFIQYMRAQLYSLDEIRPMIVERWGLPPEPSKPRDDRT